MLIINDIFHGMVRKDQKFISQDPKVVIVNSIKRQSILFLITIRHIIISPGKGEQDQCEGSTLLIIMIFYERDEKCSRLRRRRPQKLKF